MPRNVSAGSTLYHPAGVRVGYTSTDGIDAVDLITVEPLKITGSAP